MNTYWRMIWVLSLLLAGSCSTYDVVEKAESDALRTAVDKKQTTDLPYAQFIMGPGDTVRVNVWRNDDQDGIFRIDQSGYIYLPLTGAFKASGLTVTQLAEKIAAGLSKYIVDPKVAVNVETIRSCRVQVFGEVKSPGLVILDEELRVWEVIARSGGFTVDANERSVLLVRSEGGIAKVRALALKMEDMIKAGTLHQVEYLKDGDVVYVPRSAIGDIERFIARFNSIIDPFISTERAIIFAPEVIDALKGTRKESQILISP